MKTHTRKTLGRRSFLRGLLAGGAAVTLPLPRLAMALDDNGDRFVDGQAVPGRFGVWFFGNGIDPPKWHPAGSGGVGGAWSLSEQLAPLAAFKEYLTVLTGFEVKTGDAHVGGTAGAMTGAPPDELGSAMLPSIDQVVAKIIGDQTAYRSIEVGLSKATPAGAQPVLHAISHQGPAAPLYPEFDPHRLFGRLFGVSAAAPELRTARRSVLDAVLQDFKEVSGLVGQADRQRLEAHAEGIRALERRLERTPGASCGLVSAPGAAIQADDREEAPAALNDAMSQMIAMALACDLTHVFSYCFTLPAGHVYYRHLGADFDRSFHEDIVHLVDGIDNGYGLVTQGVRYAMECLAVTLGHLKAQTTATGGNLLDEMCVFSTSEVSAGWTHDMRDHPLLLIGKAGGRLRTDLHHVVSGQRNASEVLMTIANLYGAGVSEYGLQMARATTGVSEVLAG